MSRITTGSGKVVIPEESNRFLNVKLSEILEENLLKSIQDRHFNTAIIGVIFSTVKRAYSFADEVAHQFGEENITVAHSRFVGPDRLINDSTVLSIAGKNSQRETFKIVIGTQVLEQSLDIDFDLLFSDIAPVDLLIQRMGRLHRHARENRPCDPEFVIIRQEDDISSKRIYGNWLIKVANSLLSTVNEIKIPQDIEYLVEYLPNEYQIDADYMEFQARNVSIREKAKAYTLRKPESDRRKSIHDILTLEGNLVAAEAKVRNIEQPSLEVIAVFNDYNEGLWVPVIKKGNLRGKFFLSGNGDIDWVEQRAILSSTLRLPGELCNNDFITVLETMMDSSLRQAWSEFPALKDQLVIVFNSNDFHHQIADVNGTILTYDTKRGLDTQRV